MTVWLWHIKCLLTWRKTFLSGYTGSYVSPTKSTLSWGPSSKVWNKNTSMVFAKPTKNKLWKSLTFLRCVIYSLTEIVKSTSWETIVYWSEMNSCKRFSSWEKKWSLYFACESAKLSPTQLTTPISSWSHSGKQVRLFPNGPGQPLILFYVLYLHVLSTISHSYLPTSDPQSVLSCLIIQDAGNSWQ